MKLHDLRPPPGSTRPRRRVGRGIAGKGGKTAGRGTKGQGARDTIPPGLRGRPAAPDAADPQAAGFKNPFRVEYTPVNLDALQSFEGDAVDIPGTLVARGLVRKGALVKVLGRGELTAPVRCQAHAFSGRPRRPSPAPAAASSVVPLPFGHGRPPAQGNALTNR